MPRIHERDQCNRDLCGVENSASAHIIDINELNLAFPKLKPEALAIFIDNTVKRKEYIVNMLRRKIRSRVLQTAPPIARKAYQCLSVAGAYSLTQPRTAPCLECTTTFSPRRPWSASASGTSGVTADFTTARLAFGLPRARL